MNCVDFRNLLLAEEDAGRPSAVVRDHLEGCGDCRVWQRRLLQLERSVRLLPVPASDGKVKVAGLFRSEAAPRKEPVPLDGSGTAAFPEPIVTSETVRFGLRKLIPRHRWYAAAGVAAAILVLVFDGFVLWNPHGPPVKETKKEAARDPFLASLMERNLRLAEAESPKKRLEALADLADDLQSHTQKLIRQAQAKDLQQLAQLYDRVIREGITQSARDVPPAQRIQVFEPIVNRLTRATLDAEGMRTGIPADSAGALQLIASAAQRGRDELRLLVQERTP
jgi:hypothetical protein